MLLVGIGAVGAVVPGLPTTVFLLGASWCFARSCPYLEKKLLGARIFRPFQAWLRPDGEISRRSRGVSIALMWTAISVSAGLLATGTPPRIGVAAGVVALGFVGTGFIATHGRRRRDGAPPDRRPT